MSLRMSFACCLSLVVLSLLVVRPSSATVTDDALELVELYYAMQGQADISEETTDAGLMAALELLAAGYDVQALTDLVVQVHREIPGAASQPFELIFPAFARATLGRGNTATAATQTNAATTTPRTTPRFQLGTTTALATGDTMALRTRVRGGLAVSAVFDLVGLALFCASPAAGAEALGVMAILMGVGSTFATIGSVIGTSAMSTRHAGYVRAGFRPPRGKMAGAWVLTGWSIALGVATWVLPMIGGVIAAGVNVILEVINMLSVRKKWNEQLIQSEVTARALRFTPPTVAVLPRHGAQPSTLNLSVAF